ncbi:isochorismatase family protein [Pseudarthrobacter equi]|uniref:isochorismatase family protein n=1 Tax=Pseudarthrobacter equi TaxID=728066 RepID=UPI0028D37987|nr:isochorismatase family protein [Pseudarthrobacter equi]
MRERSPLPILDALPALIVVDLQAGTLSNPTVHPVDTIVARSAELADAFRCRSLPVVLAYVVGSPAGRTDYGGGARHYPPGFSAPAVELGERPGDIVAARSAWSAFAGTDLDATLKKLGVTQVVLAGVATSFGIESTARAAYDLGYSVVVVTDAVTDLSVESHVNSIKRVFPVLGQTVSTADVVAAF